MKIFAFRLFHIIVFLFGVLSIALGEGEEDKGMFSSLHLPLDANGNLVIKEVPVQMHGGPMEARAAAMCAPVYAASDKKSDSMRDINLISQFKIGITFKSLSKDGMFHVDEEMNMVIDLSNAEYLPREKVNLYDVVQAILVCMRVDVPPGFLGKVNVKIINARDTSLFLKLEGPLWSFGYNIPDNH